jgi:hypothetical protein
MQQSCEFKGMSHFCCLIALLPVVPFIATENNGLLLNTAEDHREPQTTTEKHFRAQTALYLGTEGPSVPDSNFGQFGSPRQFGLPAGQFCFINRAICTEENRFQVGIPKMLKMGTEGPSVPDSKQFWAIRPNGRAILLHKKVQYAQRRTGFKLGFQKCLKWGQRVPLSPMPGNFGQFGSPRQFGQPAGQFSFINRAICTEENRFQVEIPKMLKMGTEGPSVPDSKQFWAIRAS